MNSELVFFSLFLTSNCSAVAAARSYYEGVK